VGFDATQSVRIINDGTGNLTGSAAVIGPDANQFSCVSGCSFDLPPDDWQDVTVEFHPTTPGAKSATLRITSNDEPESPCDVPLTGTGLPPDLVIAYSHCQPSDGVELKRRLPRPASKGAGCLTLSNDRYAVDLDCKTGWLRSAT